MANRSKILDADFGKAVQQGPVYHSPDRHVGARTRGDRGVWLTKPLCSGLVMREPTRRRQPKPKAPPRTSARLVAVFSIHAKKKLLD